MNKKARVRVEAKKNSSVDKLLRDLRNACEKYGISKISREKQFFVRKSDKKRKKKIQKMFTIKKALDEASGIVKKERN